MAPKNPDPDALELIAQSQRPLYGYICSLVYSQDAADDILQETNVVLCRRIHEFDGRVKFLTWACGIAYHKVLAHRRRSSRDRLTFADDSTLEQLSALALDESSAADMRLRLLRECKGELPASQQEMLDHRYGPNGSVEGLAKGLGRSPSSVSVTLHRIRRRISKCIEEKLACEDAS